jgi:hypothetical protein
MIRQLGYILFLLVLTTACKTEEEIQTAAEALAEKEFSQIDITRVDRYPLFENCDEMLTTPDCFYTELHQLVTEKLSRQIYDYKWTTKDSLVAAITVKASGQVQYDSIVSAAASINQKELDSIFRKQLYPLCKIEPAILQGIPVTTSYLLPIKITAVTESVD